MSNTKEADCVNIISQFWVAYVKFLHNVPLAMSHGQWPVVCAIMASEMGPMAEIPWQKGSIRIEVTVYYTAYAITLVCSYVAY